MKKKIIIPIGIVALFLVIGFIIFDNNKIVSTITLDINPSIEINLTRNEKVKSVVALNEDAKEIVNGNLKGKSIDDTLKQITDNLIEKGYVAEENFLEIILYSEGDISNKELETKLKETLEKKKIDSNITTIEKVSKEDEELAKKYDVSPAKISYIKSIIKDNENINIEDLSNKSVSELNETKATGKYCDKGYTLEGDWCLKEKERISATSSEVCPRGYAEHEGKCYEEIEGIEGNNYTCGEEFKLSNDKCIREQVYDAIGKCDSGNYDQGYCVEKEYIGEPTEYCRLTPATDILMDHKCYGPKPTINGGCANNDKIINGKCVDLDSYYDADWICQIEGKIQYVKAGEKCYKETKTKPTSYYCDGNDILNGTKCETHEIEDARKERTCPNGTIPIDDGGRCLNLNKTVAKESGFICENENSRLEGNMCVIYEMIEAKFN